MAKRIYQTKTIHLVDGTVIELKPLKLKYLHKVMDIFYSHLNKEKTKMTEMESLDVFILCAFESMQQFLPDKIKTIEDLEDHLTMDDLYDVLEYGAGLKLRKDDDGNPVMEKSNKDDSGSGWEDLDLVELESEVFTIGVWKDFEELEANLSMPELLSILSSKRELEYNEKKFLAALQGVDLDKGNKDSAQNKWEEMKARVFSKGQTSDPNDILSLQGVNAQKVGFGIGMGLDYEDARDPKLMKN